MAITTPAAGRIETAEENRMTYMRYQLTGKGSPLASGVVWDELLATVLSHGARYVGESFGDHGLDHQRAYFEVPNNTLQSVSDALNQYGHVTEISPTEFQKWQDSIPIP